MGKYLEIARQTSARFSSREPPSGSSPEKGRALSETPYTTLTTLTTKVAGQVPYDINDINARVPETPGLWPAIQDARCRAESTHDPRDAWAATLDEVALWWRLAGAFEELQLGEYLDQRLMAEIGAAIRTCDRATAFLRIEEWRQAWLHVLGQDDLVSTGRLNVIDSFRRLKG